MMSLTEYQLKNILSQNVPRKLVAWDLPDLESQLKQWLKSPLPIVVDPVDQVQEIMNWGLDKPFPIIVICEDGHRSQKVVEELSQNGYLNVYYLEQGLGSLQL